MVDVGVQTPEQGQLAQDFVQFAIESGVLRFGEFKTKAGRLSPYFFNSGLFNDGDSLLRLSQFYAKAIAASGLEFDLLPGAAEVAGTIEIAAQAVGQQGLRLGGADHAEQRALVGAFEFFPSLAVVA